MKTIRTVTQTVEADEPVRGKPEFSVGDYVEIYSGRYQDHCFWIRDIRWNHDDDCFEYLYPNVLMGGWYRANHLVLRQRGGAKT